MYGWRMFVVFKFSSRRKQRAILVADSKEAQELEQEINSNSRYDLFIEVIKPSFDMEETISSIGNFLKNGGVSMVIIDTHHPLLIGVIPSLYPFATQGILFFDIGKIYETIFDRIPVSVVGETWFIEHMSSMAPKLVYDVIKRLIDVVMSLVLGLISLLIYPFIILAIKIEDKGQIFTYQPRTGQYNKIINIVKFRTMTIANDNGFVGTNKVTKVGFFLRKSRLDELPQLWNVFIGDLSLVGPRPELPMYVEKYSKEIPYYSIRHSVKPGLSGWAQIYGEHPHHGVDIERTSNKLSYDLYYIKHRSFLLDLKIALQTLQVLITFAGR